MFDRNILKEIFNDKLIHTDDRTPLFILRLGGEKWGFFLPHLTMWSQVLAVSKSCFTFPWSDQLSNLVTLNIWLTR